MWIYGYHPDNWGVLFINTVYLSKKMLIKDEDNFVDQTSLGLKFNECDMVFAHSFRCNKSGRKIEIKVSIFFYWKIDTFHAWTDILVLKTIISLSNH